MFGYFYLIICNDLENQEMKVDGRLTILLMIRDYSLLNDNVCAHLSPGSSEMGIAFPKNSLACPFPVHDAGSQNANIENGS